MYIFPKFNRLTDEQQQHSFNVWIDGWMEGNMLGFFSTAQRNRSPSTVYGQQPYWGVGKLREWNSIYLVLVRRLFHPHIESNYFGATFFRSFAGVFFHFWMQCISLPASQPACLFVCLIACCHAGSQRFSLKHCDRSENSYIKPIDSLHNIQYALSISCFLSFQAATQAHSMDPSVLIHT